MKKKQSRKPSIKSYEQRQAIFAQVVKRMCVCGGEFVFMYNQSSKNIHCCDKCDREEKFNSIYPHREDIEVPIMEVGQ